MQSGRWMIIKIYRVCWGVANVCEYKCVRTCLSPAELSGVSAKDDFISHTQITFVFIKQVGVSSLSLSLALFLFPPLSLCVHACVCACMPSMCVKSGQRSAAAGLRALRMCLAIQNNSRNKLFTYFSYQLGLAHKTSCTNFVKQFFESFTKDVPKLKLMNDVKFKIKLGQEIEVNVIHVLIRIAECVYVCVSHF